LLGLRDCDSIAQTLAKLRSDMANSCEQEDIAIAAV
jgi:hypothetical protein